jgi:hypothetical protein
VTVVVQEERLKKQRVMSGLKGGVGEESVGGGF